MTPVRGAAPAVETEADGSSDTTTAPIIASAYRTAAPLYISAGWKGVLPLPRGAKWPPPPGFTGADGADPTPEQIENWRRRQPTGNVALRLPDGVVGLDIDAYADRAGGATLAALEAVGGPLPATWRSTSRPDDPVSGIRYFRTNRTEGAWRDPGPGVDLIRHGHRYAAVWPSVHPEGRRYVWFGPHGGLAARAPRVDELPSLPPDWLRALVPPPVTPRAPIARRDLRAPAAFERARLGRWANEVLTAPDGARNTALFKAAFKAELGIQEGWLRRDEAEHVLTAAAARAGLGDHEIQCTLRSARRQLRGRVIA